MKKRDRDSEKGTKMDGWKIKDKTIKVISKDRKEQEEETVEREKEML